MSDRYTRKDAEAAFARLASALGKTWSDRDGTLWHGKSWEPEAVPSDYYPDRQAQLWTSEDAAGGWRNHAAVGAWYLDWNPTYGGGVIHEMANDGGGVSWPLGHTRRNAREFCDAVAFTMDALRVLGKLI